MTRAKKYSLFLTLGTVLLLIMAACSTTGTSSQPVIQVLQKSSTAMKQLKSAHFETHASVTLKADLTGTPTSAAQKLSNFSFNVTTSGDEAMPDKASVHVTLGDNSLGLTGTYAAILLGDKLYIQNAAGQWYVLDKSVLQHDGKTTPGTNQPDLNKLLAAAEKAAKLTDHGVETLNGESLRHVTVALDKDGVKQILANDPDLSSQIGQQNVDKLLNSTKSFNGSIDLWIDESTSYVHRAEVKVNLDINPSALAVMTTDVSASDVMLTLDTVTDLSKFNDPVTISAPANAIPTDNPITIFGL